MTLPTIKVIKAQSAGELALITLVSKDTIAAEAHVFCSPTRYDQLFVFTNLATRLSVKRRSDIATISKKVYLYLYHPPSEI